MTLIELMVVLAISAVAIGLVAWGFGAQRPRQRLLGAATELHALVHGARQSALATGRRTIVVFFPQYQTGDLSWGRVFVVEDSNLNEFFSSGTGNDQLSSLGEFDPSDPSRFGTLVAGSSPQGGILDSMDLPPGVAFGPAGGQGAGTRTAKPFDIPLDAACTFCLGVNSRGAIAFDATGRATFWSANGRDPLNDVGFQKGASVSLMADEVREVKTLVIAAPTGAVQTLSLVLP